MSDTNTSPAHPLIDPPPTEVPLPQAPLIRVIVQVRFPPIAKIARLESIADFQEALRDRYPVMSQVQSQSLTLVHPNTIEASAALLWRFSELDGPWNVTLAPDFIALETSRYSSRDDFMARLAHALHALHQHLGPRTSSRLGVRYIDQLSGDELDHIPRLFRPELAWPMTNPLGARPRFAICEQQLAASDADPLILLRWGLVPPNQTIDPSAIPPCPAPSWLLDVDISEERHALFEPERLTQQARGFAERAYTLFRWAVTDEFLAYFGGKP